ncbi:MAG: DNA adenine methylase [Prevotellaceae bacterium]|nr:DNA adenine methylase [Prevotellaceae bacterium]
MNYYQAYSFINFVKPFVKWVGGKGQLVSTIENELPANLLYNSKMTYIEPFVGGGAMLFWVLKNTKIEKAIINDINPDLTKAYQTVKENVGELILRLKEFQNEYNNLWTLTKRTDYFLANREKYNKKTLDNVENTALFIFLNKTCFNGLYRVNNKGKFNVPFGKYGKPTICDEKTLLADSESLQKVEILNGDFEQTLNYADENAFFYFDPPYKPISKTSSFNSYTKENFSDNEQIRLKNFTDTISNRGSCWLLSNSDNIFFYNLYAGYNIDRVFATRAVNCKGDGRGKLTELLIKNYEKSNLNLQT